MSDDFAVQRQSIHGWRVLSTRNDSQTAHKVNTRDLTCSCEDAEWNREGNEVCDHLAHVLTVAPTDMAVGEALNFDLHKQVQELNGHVKSIERRATAIHADTQADGSQAGTDGAESSTDDDAEDSGVVVEADPSGDQQGLLDDLQSWFAQAAGFNDFDPRIIDLSWVEADGTPGIEVDRSPFDGGYYDDGEWQDKDEFEDHKETVKDTVLSPRDEFEWFGEPDYSWFIAQSDVSEVLE